VAKKAAIRHDQIVHDFAAKLREERHRKGLSQRELAVLARVNIGYQGKLERGEAAPGIDLLGRLAEALGVAPGALLGPPVVASNSPRLKDIVRRRMEEILRRNDTVTLEALAVITAHIEDSLGRRARP